MVVVAKNDCNAVLEKSGQRVEVEKKKTAQLQAGASSVELNKLDEVFKKLGLVED
jgi:hypothetical protein